MNGQGEIARRRRQIAKGQIVPTLLRAHWDALAAAVAAVGGRVSQHDGELSARLYDTLNDAFGMMPTWDREAQRWRVSNIRYVDPSEPREHLKVKGYRVFRQAVSA